MQSPDKKTIRLRAFGKPVITWEDGEPIGNLSRQTKRLALFIYLVSAEGTRAHRRDEILAMFWPEANEIRGRNALRQSLHCLRRELGPEVIKGNGPEELQINQNVVSSDVGSFLEGLRESSPETALAVYRGDFLSGFHLSGSRGFEGWVEDQRQYLRGLAGNAARDLAHRAEGSRDLSTAIYWWRRTMEYAPFDEKALRRVMVLMAGSGNRGQAMSEFLRFRRAAQRELGASLSPETLELARKVSDGQQAFDLEWLWNRRKRPLTSFSHPTSFRRIGDLD